MSKEEMPKGVELFDFADHASARKHIFEGVKDEFTKVFPQAYGGVRLSVDNVDYADPEEYSLRDQKEALLKDKFLARRLRGTLTLHDDKTNEVLDSRDMTLLRVPYLTERGTFIHGGNEYTSIMQSRLLPGAYTRRQSNGGLETQFNVRTGTGTAFRVGFEPDTSQYRLRVQQANLHLYSLLHDLGVPDEHLGESWGPEVLAANQRKYDPRVFDKAYARFVSKRVQNPDAEHADKVIHLKEALEAAKIHAGVARRTLPNLFDISKAASWRKQQARMDLEEEFVKNSSQSFAPDYSPDELTEHQNAAHGVGPRLAGMAEWPAKWLPEFDSSWMEWYRQYHVGRRTDDDATQIMRWKRFKRLHGDKLIENPTPRRAFALKAWAIDPLKLIDGRSRGKLERAMAAYKTEAEEKHEAKKAMFEDEDLHKVAAMLNHEFHAGIDEGALDIENEVFSFLGARPDIDGELLYARLGESKMASYDVPDGIWWMEKLARYGAGVLFKQPNGKYLLQENGENDCDDASGVGKLRPAGGGKNKSDHNLRATILREMEEEFDIDPEEAKGKIELLGYINEGPFEDCAMFVMEDHGLKPGVYQASNSKSEKIKLVEADLDDKRYIGKQPDELRPFADSSKKADEVEFTLLVPETKTANTNVAKVINRTFNHWGPEMGQMFSIEGRLPDLYQGARKFLDRSSINNLVFAKMRQPGVINIDSSHMDEFRNVGAGRKAYGMLFRKIHELAEAGAPIQQVTSDFNGRTSAEAQNLWRSLQRRGYPITEEASAGAVNRNLNPNESAVNFLLDVPALKEFYARTGIHKQASEDGDDYECPHCHEDFDYNEEPEVAMGTVACPHCKKFVPQDGKPHRVIMRFTRFEIHKLAKMSALPFDKDAAVRDTGPGSWDFDQGMVNDPDAARLKAFADAIHRSPQPWDKGFNAEEFINTYSARGHEAMNVKPYGAEVLPWIAQARRAYGVVNPGAQFAWKSNLIRPSDAAISGIDFNAPVAKPFVEFNPDGSVKGIQESALHYLAFRHSPAAAYRQLWQEFDAPSTGRIAQLLDKYQVRHPKFEAKGFDTFVSQLDPEFHKRKQTIDAMIGKDMRPTAQVYADFADKALGWDKALEKPRTPPPPSVMPYVAGGAAALGAAGLAYWLWQKHRKKKRGQEKRASAKQLESTESAHRLALAELKKAKEHSDRREYGHKSMIMSRLFREHPDDFIMDDDWEYAGITHVPTGFQIHVPRNTVPAAIATSPLTKVWQRRKSEEFKRMDLGGADVLDDMAKNEPKAVVHYADPHFLDSIRSKGLMSPANILKDPEALGLVAESTGRTPEEQAAHFTKRIAERDAARGPNVVVPPPAGLELGDNHPVHTHNMVPIRVKLEELLRDHPGTKLHGLELSPYADNASIHERHHEVSPEEWNGITSRSPEEIWKHYKPSKEGYYAANVPHAAVVTPSGNIDPKYLEIPESKSAAKSTHWIGVDLDRTLAFRPHGVKGIPFIGAPIPAMKKRVMAWINGGQKVKIFTARASSPGAIPPIRAWLKTNGFPALEITNEKDQFCVAIYDDLAVAVDPNTGRLLSPAHDDEQEKSSTVLHPDGHPMDVDAQGQVPVRRAVAVHPDGTPMATDDQGQVPVRKALPAHGTPPPEPPPSAPTQPPTPPPKPAPAAPPPAPLPAAPPSAPAPPKLPDAPPAPAPLPTAPPASYEPPAMPTEVPMGPTPKVPTTKVETPSLPRPLAVPPVTTPTPVVAAAPPAPSVPAAQPPATAPAPQQAPAGAPVIPLKADKTWTGLPILGSGVSQADAGEYKGGPIFPNGRLPFAPTPLKQPTGNSVSFADLANPLLASMPGGAEAFVANMAHRSAQLQDSSPGAPVDYTQRGTQVPITRDGGEAVSQGGRLNLSRPSSRPAHPMGQPGVIAGGPFDGVGGNSFNGYYSKAHKWIPEQPQNQGWEALHEADHAFNGASNSAYLRQPGTPGEGKTQLDRYMTSSTHDSDLSRGENPDAFKSPTYATTSAPEAIRGMRLGLLGLRNSTHLPMNTPAEIHQAFGEIESNPAILDQLPVEASRVFREYLFKKDRGDARGAQHLRDAMAGQGQGLTKNDDPGADVSKVASLDPELRAQLPSLPQ
jgi:hypothetical protein